jgi:calcium-dependent protein kinase
LVGKDGRVMKTKLGTPYYVSPEVLEGVYDKRCDLWALGVLTFMLLVGEPPFNGNDENAVFNKIKCCDYDFEERLWKDISKEAQDFISKFLNPDPKRRMTPEQALLHKWIIKVKETKEVNIAVMDRLERFSGPNRLQ